MPTLGAQCVGHNARILSSILEPSIHDDEELIGCSKKVPLCDCQRSIIFSPVEARGRAATSYALQDSSFTSGYCSVFQGPDKGRSFCGSGENKQNNRKITSQCNPTEYSMRYKNPVLQPECKPEHRFQHSNTPNPCQAVRDVVPEAAHLNFKPGGQGCLWCNYRGK